MGKIDDMRRQREQQFADGQLRQAKAAKARAVDVVVVPPARVVAPPVSDADAEPLQPTRPTRPTRPTGAQGGTDAKPTTSSKSRGAVAESGKCPECGKMKPVSNGLMASHQKGFGKACPGSRKKPAS
jgi:hypothetical protein